MTQKLVLVRHGQSEWNLKNLFTGWKDVELTETGVGEAHTAGQDLKSEGISFDMAFTSNLKRAQITLSIMLDELGQTGLETIKNEALNERDYGDLTGLNKDDAREKWGEEQVHIWRRSYDIPPPGGESLKTTAERVLPYFQSEIVPHLEDGKTIIIAAHGNSLRALVMELEGLSREEVLQLNIATGKPIIYTIGEGAKVTGKKDLGEGAPAH